MQATFQTKIHDRSVYPALDALAALYGRLLRRLFVDLYVRKRPLVECKRESIARDGITARYFNALATDLKAKVKAAEEAHRHHLAHLRGQIQSTERAIAKLQKQAKALASGKGRWATLAPEERAARRRRIYGKFSALLMARAAREGVEVLRVNPAFTSVIGKVKFMARYGLSPHAAAAVAIARRGLGLGERLRSGTARPLPARNRGWHVWSDWRRIAPSVRGQRAHRLYERSSEDAPGRGEPRSTRAPAANNLHGPGCDGLAWGPGCDPLARIVGSTVRPAS